MSTGYPLVDGIIGAIVALVGAYGVWATGRKALADARALKTPPATPYEALAERVTALETPDAEKSVEISRLRNQIRRLTGVLTREVATILDWHDSGSPPPPRDRETRVVRDLIHDLENDQAS